MRLLKASTYLRRYFEPGSPKPTVREIKQGIEDGEIPGKILLDVAYVDLNRIVGQRNTGAVQKTSSPDLLS